MKGLLISLIMLMAFALTSILSYAQNDPPTAANTQLSQPLIREGDLAVDLAEGLKVGAPNNEAEAEDMLSASGISPRNGWMADYPATPDIIGELQAAISAAADSGKLGVGKDAALKKFQEVINGDNLPVRPDTSGNGDLETFVPSYPDTTAMDNYYSNEGPPVVTYYAPPPDYAYLYSWTPYPFWWENDWFPGFFVLADFNVRVHGHDHGHGHGHPQHGHDGFITNHFHDPKTGTVTRVDPANRFRGGTLPPGGHTGRTIPAVPAGGRTASTGPAGRTGGHAVSTVPAARGGAGAGPDRGYGVTQNPAGTRSSAFEHSVNSQSEHAASDRGFQSRSNAGYISGGGAGVASPSSAGGGARSSGGGSVSSAGGGARGGGGGSVSGAGGGARGGGGGGFHGGGGGKR